MKPYYKSNGVTLFLGDCREVMPTLDPVHAIICDPPYEIGFMGKKFDKTGVAHDPAIWREALRVLKPGGHLLAFGGTRTYHRLACAIEDAGFECREVLAWLFGSGFPKNLSVSKAIDKAARGVPQGGADPTSPNHGQFKGGCSEDNPSGQGFGAGPGQFMRKGMGKQNPEWNGTAQGRKENSFKSEYLVTPPKTDAAKEWDGYGTALKPAMELICLARKPIEGTVAVNVQKHGTGALNIDGCRIDTDKSWPSSRSYAAREVGRNRRHRGYESQETSNDGLGRWPANVIHDGSDEVVSMFPDATGQQGFVGEKNGERPSINTYGDFGPRPDTFPRGDSGSAARFFYTAKASREERSRGMHDTEEQITDDGRNIPIDNPYLRGKTLRSNTHPTVKPLDLMAYLCKLLCPPSGGILLDPFMGSGSTIIAGQEILPALHRHRTGREICGDRGQKIKPRGTRLWGCRVNTKDVDDFFLSDKTPEPPPEPAPAPPPPPPAEP